MGLTPWRLQHTVTHTWRKNYTGPVNAMICAKAKKIYGRAGRIKAQSTQTDNIHHGCITKEMSSISVLLLYNQQLYYIVQDNIPLVRNSKSRKVPKTELIFCPYVQYVNIQYYFK